MLKKRLIPVLILRDGQVVQSIQFRHNNVIHWNPMTAVRFFNHWAVDEIVLLDVSRTQEKREKFFEALALLAKECFVPLTAGGWITSVAEMRDLLRRGADKVTINTQAVETPELITECADVFGSQCVVVAIDARFEEGEWRVYTDRGKERTDWLAVDWAKEAQARGAGEIFLTSIDHDGTRDGYALDLMQAVSSEVSIPVVAFGGAFQWQHLVDGIQKGGAEAASAANVFHFTEHSTKKAKAFMREQGLDVR